MTLWQDVHFALRTMRRSPRVSAIVMLTLALGIGANTAIFSVVNAALLRPLPFREPGQLVQLGADLRGLGAQNIGFSQPEMKDLSDRAGIFDAVSAVWQFPGNMTGGEHPERIEGLAVSTNYFGILGSHPQLGRLFDSRDEANGFAEALVISDGLWHKEFGGDAAVLGRQLRLDNDLYTVVGVLPADFKPPSAAGSRPVDLYVTAGFAADPFPAPQRNVRFIPGMIARVKPGITVQQAQARLAAMTESLRHDYGSDYPAEARWTLTITPLKEMVVGDSQTLLISLLLAVAFILLIACVNVANLLLANASARQREISIRMALGADRRRIIRQMLTECAVLSLAASAMGVAAAAVTQRSLIAWLPANLPHVNAIHIDFRVLAFSLLVALATTVLFGLAPALQASRMEPGATDFGARGGSASLHDTRLRKALIGAEVALSLMLLVAAGLLLRTFWDLLHVDPGFNSRQLIAGSVWLPQPNDPKSDVYATTEQRTAFSREVVRRLTSVPGVESASLSSVVPLQGQLPPTGFRAEGSSQQGDAPTAVGVLVTPDFFRTLGASLLRGRMIVDSDDSKSQQVVLVDEAAARQFWGTQDPVGRRIRFARNFIVNGKVQPAPWMTVVGVVSSLKLGTLDEKDVPHVYGSMYQISGKLFGVLVRGQGDATTLGRAVQKEIQSVDPNLPVSDIRAMPELMNDAVGDRRFAAWLLGTFAVVALLLASIGVYGVASYTIVRRTRELGIRSALGASPGELVRMVLRDGMVPVLGGLIAGCVGAVLGGRMLASLLYGVRADDAGVFSAAGVLLVLVAVAANYIPARRAGRVNPLVALRTE